MTKTLKIAVVATTTLVLANCSGIGGGGNDGANLPVRNGPQSQLPYTAVIPTTVIVTDA